PTVRGGIISSPAVRTSGGISRASTPDDHFTAGPDCRMNVPTSGRIDGAGSCPNIRVGIVSPAGVQNSAGVTSTPDDHFNAGPDCRVKVSSTRSISGGRSGPRIIAAFAIIGDRGKAIGASSSYSPLIG